MLCGLNDFEPELPDEPDPAAYDEDLDPIGLLLSDECIISSQVQDAAVDVITSDKDSNGNTPTKCLTSSSVLQRSFGFSDEKVSNMLKMIPVSLKQKLDVINVVLDSIPYGTDAWMQILNHIERFKITFSIMEATICYGETKCVV